MSNKQNDQLNETLAENTVVASDSKTQVEKIVELYDQMQTICPNSSISVSIHGINLNNLSSDWEVTGSVTSEGHRFWSASRIPHKSFDITLFE